MPYLQNATHEGFIFNEATKAQFLGNGVHAAMAMRYFVANLPTGQLDGNNQPIYANYNIGQAVGLYSSNGTGANLTEIYLDPVKLAITAKETELSNVTVWSANSILTQSRGDSRYQPIGSYLANATTWLTTDSGTDQIIGLQTNTSTYQTFSGTGVFGSSYLGVRTLASNTAISYIKCDPTAAPFGRVTIFHNGATFTFNNRGISVGSTANFTWGDNDFSTVGFNDARYQNAANNTWANLTGKPTLATVATSGNYSDLSGTPNLSLYPTLAANNSFTGCNTFTGQINCNSTLALSGNLVTAPKIQAYSETANAPSISGGNLTLNLSLANVFGPVTLNANISNLTISNPPASGTAGSFTLLLKANGTAFTVTWPASVLWAGGTAPTLTSTANKTDVFSFVTTDGGTSYYGFKAGQNF